MTGSMIIPGLLLKCLFLVHDIRSIVNRVTQVSRKFRVILFHLSDYIFDDNRSFILIFVLFHNLSFSDVFNVHACMIKVNPITDVPM